MNPITSNLASLSEDQKIILETFAQQKLLLETDNSQLTPEKIEEKEKFKIDILNYYYDKTYPILYNIKISDEMKPLYEKRFDADKSFRDILVDRFSLNLIQESKSQPLKPVASSQPSSPYPDSWVKFDSDDAIESPLANQSSQLIKIKTSGRENLCGYHALANVLSMMPRQDRFAGYQNIELDDTKARLLYENVVNEMPNLRSSKGVDLKTRENIFEDIFQQKMLVTQEPEAKKDSIINFFVNQFTVDSSPDPSVIEAINQRWNNPGQKQEMIDEFFDDKFQKEAKTDFTLAEFQAINQDFKRAQQSEKYPQSGKYLEVLDQVKPSHAFEKDKIEGVRAMPETERLVITPGYNQKLIGEFLHQKWDNEWKQSQYQSQSPFLTPSITAEIMESTNISAESLKIIAKKINPGFELLGQDLINQQYQEPNYQPTPLEPDKIPLYVSNNSSGHYSAMTPLSQYQDRLLELGHQELVSVYPDRSIHPSSPRLNIYEKPSSDNSHEKDHRLIKLLCSQINDQTKLQALFADLNNNQTKEILLPSEANSNVKVELYKRDNDYGLIISSNDENSKSPNITKISLANKAVDIKLNPNSNSEISTQDQIDILKDVNQLVADYPLNFKEDQSSANQVKLTLKSVAERIIAQQRSKKNSGAGNTFASRVQSTRIQSNAGFER